MKPSVAKAGVVKGRGVTHETLRAFIFGASGPGLLVQPVLELGELARGETVYRAWGSVANRLAHAAEFTNEEENAAVEGDTKGGKQRLTARRERERT